MGWVYRKPSDRTNPTIPGGVYGRYITAGIGVYWKWDGSRVRFILFLCDGGRFGMNTPDVIEYKSVPLLANEYRFHPGTFPQQIVQLYGDALTSSVADDYISILDQDLIDAGVTLADNDAVMFSGSVIPHGIQDGKVWIVNFAAHPTETGYSIFNLSSTDPTIATTLIDITYIKTTPAFPIPFYKAVSGFQDPVQGLPQFCPEVETTFSGISYIEGILPAAYDENQEPDWGDFRVVGIGRKVMDFDENGDDIGISSVTAVCCNPAVIDANHLIYDFNKAKSRIDWDTWQLLREAADTQIWQRPEAGTGSGVGIGWNAEYFSFPIGNIPPDVDVDGTSLLKRVEDAVNMNWGSTAPAPTVPADAFFVKLKAGITPRYDETYTFRLTSSGGTRLYVDGDLVIDNWVVNGGIADQVLDWPTVIGSWSINPATGAANTISNSGDRILYGAGIADTEQNFYYEITYLYGGTRLGLHPNNSDNRPEDNLLILHTGGGVAYKADAFTPDVYISTWSPGDKFKIGSEGRIMVVYKNDVKLGGFPPIPLPASGDVYPFYHLYPGIGGAISAARYGPAPGSSSGIEEGTHAMDPSDPSDIEVQFFKATGNARVKLEWFSTSQAVEIVPKTLTSAPSTEVKRYEFNGAYPTPTEASAVHDEIIKHCPGWDWTDIDGKITYLPPDRPVVYEFVYDKEDDNTQTTIVDKSFSKVRRNRRDRKNFVLYSYRNQESTGYPEKFIEQNRPRLRELSGGIPSNDAPADLMVMTRSLAERVAANDMIFNNDPTHDTDLAGKRASGIVKKNQIVIVKNIVEESREVENERGIISAVDRKGADISFSIIMPIPEEFYEDEEV